MELEDVESELWALRKLYGLLQSNGNDSQSASSKYLDEKAWIFLKKLLDGATERVYEAHSKFIAAQLRVFDKSSATKPENIKRRCRVCQQSCVKKIKFAEGGSHKNDQKLNMDTVSLQHQQPNQSNNFYWGKGLELNKQGIQSGSSIESQQQEIIHKIQPNLTGAGSLAYTSIIQETDVTKSGPVYDFSGEIGKKNDGTDCISKEVADAIKEVELRISSLQLAADYQNLMPQKDLIRKVGTSQTSKQALSLGSMDLTNRKIQMADAGQKLSGTQAKDTNQREKGLPQQMTWRQTPDQKRSPLYGNLMEQERVREQRNRKRAAQQKVILRCQQESDDTSLASHATSCWTSEQAGTSGSGNGEYSLPSRRGDKRYMGATSSSDSEGYSLSGWTGGSYMGHTSSSESEVYTRSSSCRPHSIGPISSSENEEYPPVGWVRANRHMALSSRVVGSTSTSMGSTKVSVSGNRAKPKKQMGGLRRLKDKLALIFHHHHHHHYHHHRDDGDHRVQKNMGRGTSLWKYAGKIFHGTIKDEAYGERATEELTKLVVCKGADKNPQRHCHKLVNGMWRHVQNSRKSKMPKGGIEQLRSSQQGSKKVAKKLKWWQVFRIPRKPLVKLGLGSKKPRLRGLPKTR